MEKESYFEIRRKSIEGNYGCYYEFRRLNDTCVMGGSRYLGKSLEEVKENIIDLVKSAKGIDSIRFPIKIKKDSIRPIKQEEIKSLLDLLKEEKTSIEFCLG